MNNVKNYLKIVTFLIKCNALIGTASCLAMEPNTPVLLGMTRDMYAAIAQQPALNSSGAFHMFRKFNRDAESYPDPKVIWKTWSYQAIVNNARNLFNELSETEQFKISLTNAKRTTEDYFLAPEYDPSSKKNMYESWHIWKCTLLELIQKKLKQKNIHLQIPNSNSPADFLVMNSSINSEHYQDFMAAMVILPWIVDIQKNTVSNIEALVQKETGKMIISD